jgi:hypothetical protein
MTLPASGAISLSQVAGELAIGLSSVNLNDSRLRGLAGKASGVISLNDFHGKSNITPPTGTRSVGHTVSSTITVTLNLNSDGTISTSTSGGIDHGDSVGTKWYGSAPSAGIGSGWWVNVTVLSGTLTTGAAGWQQLNATRTWTKQVSALGAATVQLRFDFATSSGGATVATGTVNLSCTNDT